MRDGALLASIVCALACGSSSKPATTTTPVPAENTPASTGPLTEAEFKALHEAPTAGPAQRRGQMIDLAGTRAYLSLPAGEPPFAGIVVIHEWWGLNANIEHWADRLASAGYAALAVDLYGGVVATTPDEAIKTMKAVEPPKAIATLKAAVDFLAKDARTQATTLAVIGWCFGGAYALQAALNIPELDGAIIYYGQLETDPAKLAAIDARILGIFATRDRGIPNEMVDTFEAGLRQANVPHEIHRYDAEHAFANPSNPKYDEKAASDAWQKVLAFVAGLKKS